ncbi:hypothetical protein [Lentimicrobium sp. S6]|uniref:hypothetical protein n=1 Tax=Lentimicrobium sp. S6 TaxID=2735872 RepID=UPI0015555978|nr:hypothetical protein [Lentimicrobium sp. S6]NPD45081.1 hypothetical protein [Lentimicrobium sp. S6]
MKSKLIWSLLLVLCFGVIQAQELDEIISKHIEARGGAENWAKVNNMKITGRFTAFSVEEDWMAIKTNKGQYYSELHLGKHAVIEAFDGEHGWTIDPWHEISFPRILSKDEDNVFQQKSSLMTPFLDYKEKGLVAKLIGKQDLEGVVVYTIKLTRPSGKYETWYIDANTYLEYRRDSYWVDFTYPTPAESYFEDFREINGLVIPYYEEKMFSQRNRVLLIEDILFNIELDEELFEMAKSSEMEALSFMKGSWDVEVQGWSGRANKWYPMDATTSTIKYAANNMLEEKIRYKTDFVIPIVSQYSYHAGSGKYRVCVYNDFSGETEMFIGQISDSTFTADNTKMIYGGMQDPQAFGKVTITPEDSDHFNVLIENSFDKGENWNPGNKLIYTRKSN